MSAAPALVLSIPSTLPKRLLLRGLAYGAQFVADDAREAWREACRAIDGPYREIAFDPMSEEPWLLPSDIDDHCQELKAKMTLAESAQALAERRYSDFCTAYRGDLDPAEYKAAKGGDPFYLPQLHHELARYARLKRIKGFQASGTALAGGGGGE